MNTFRHIDEHRGLSYGLVGSGLARSGLVIYAPLISLLMLISVSATAARALTELDPQQRIWQNLQGHYFSVIHNPAGRLQIDDLHSGNVYRYTAGDSGLQKWPDNAPDVAISGTTIALGGDKLQPVPHQVENISFERDGVSFHGVLTLPANGDKVPLIISGHGSERSASTTFDYAPALYLQAGFASLVFDKRGTGHSGGSYTHDFQTMAQDLNAAFAALQDHPRIDPDRIGYYGPSQGVYVTTLAASLNPEVAFLIAGYGMMETPLKEDEMETRQLLQVQHPDILWSDFAPFVRACGRAFALREGDQWQTVRTLKKQWRGKVSGDDLAGTLTGDGCLSWPPFLLKLVGRSQFPSGLDWSHDPVPLVESLQIPVLWLIAGDDHEAPSETTIARIQQWQRRGKPYELKVYPGTDHGIKYWFTDQAGQRIYRRDPAFFSDQITWLTTRK